MTSEIDDVIECENGHEADLIGDLEDVDVECPFCGSGTWAVVE